MDEASALVGIAEIAVAIAGFSGVAPALGHRSDDQFWSPGQRARFVDLITHSGIMRVRRQPAPGDDCAEEFGGGCRRLNFAENPRHTLGCPTR